MSAMSICVDSWWNEMAFCLLSQQNIKHTQNTALLCFGFIFRVSADSHTHALVTWSVKCHRVPQTICRAIFAWTWFMQFFNNSTFYVTLTRKSNLKIFIPFFSQITYDNYTNLLTRHQFQSIAILLQLNLTSFLDPSSIFELLHFQVHRRVYQALKAPFFGCPDLHLYSVCALN